MSNGAQWAEMSRRYAGYATCWRRLKSWEEAGVFVKMLRTFLSAFNAKGRIVWEESFADGTRCPGMLTTRAVRGRLEQASANSANSAV